MLPPERRVADLRALIDRNLYFVVHAPRQVGKTTALSAMAKSLTAEGKYAALLTSCEVGQKLQPDLEGSMAGILAALQGQAELSLPPELRPPATDLEQPPETRLLDLLKRWSQACPRPVVLFLDEIDALYNDALISVLRQLRTGYANRPHGFPCSVALIGLRDVRDYKLQMGEPQQTLGTSSPFNVKSDSLRLRNFTAGEVAELYGQHTTETGQVFTAEAMAHAWKLTRGQPWLVNALAREAVTRLEPDPSTPITLEILEEAKEALILRRDTHLDSLADRLREERVRRVLEPILAGQFVAPNVLDDDIKFVEDLGLVTAESGSLEIANPIYQEVIPRALTWTMQITLPLARPSYVGPDGGLRFDEILEDFTIFWCEHAEFFLGRHPYHEAAAELIFMAFLQRVVNGGGTIDREYGVGRGRIDLLLRWPTATGIQRFAVELKVWRDSSWADELEQGLAQLAGYLARLGLTEGTLLLFDSRSVALPLPDRVRREKIEHGGYQMTVLRL